MIHLFSKNLEGNEEADQGIIEHYYLGAGDTIYRHTEHYCTCCGFEQDTTDTDSFEKFDIGEIID